MKYHELCHIWQDLVLLLMTQVTFFKQKELLNYNWALLIVFIKFFFSIGFNIWLAKTTTPLQVFRDAYMSSSFVTLLSIVPFQHLG
jgi:hypothetical protein